MARQTQRLTKQWRSITDSAPIALVGAGTTLAGQLDFSEPRTILRMLGEYTLGSSSTYTAGDGALIAIGIAVVSTDAATLGATALPDPGSEPEYPWMYWASHSLFSATSTGDPNAIQAGVRQGFDIRSMRKVKPRESLVFVIEYSDIAGTPPIQVGQPGVRVLIGGP